MVCRNLYVDFPAALAKKIHRSRGLASWPKEAWAKVSYLAESQPVRPLVVGTRASTKLSDGLVPASLIAHAYILLCATT